MQHPHRVSRTAVLIIFLTMLAWGSSFGGERDLWNLWNRHMQDPGNHEGMIALCRKYAAALPQDPFLPVARSLEAWHLLSSGKTGEAVRIYSAQLKAGEAGVDRGAQHLARNWVTRLLREQMAAALQYYYRKEVRYPESLDALASYPGLSKAVRLPMTDAWQAPWRYRLAGFEGVAGFRDQKYNLASRSLQPPEETAAALAMPYAERIRVEATQVSGRAGAVTVVTMVFQDGDRKGEKVLGQVGQEVEGLTVAHAGQQLVILCDDLHWKVLLWRR